uniref:UDP-glucuronosyltransferase 2C1-like n=1 Tax=Petromyzon marinus TaxID=7757 RepID=A0AAJ7X0T7_PETMA|nr:UDP-glucuronosyltransferase 2C1-like [Petromyzon marinus]XP_032817146.1 UDP-glucuronosyltransferase 2C1-like [Petromyzon marinus]
MPTLRGYAWQLPTLLLPLLLLLPPSPWSPSATAEAARILAVPVDGSHWMGMKTLLLELTRRGHSITVLRSSTTLFVDETSDDFHIENVQIPAKTVITREEGLAMAERWILDVAFAPPSSFFSTVSSTLAMARAMAGMASDMAVAIEQTLGDGALMSRLRDARFDAVLADTFYPGGPMVARALGLPVALLGRWEVGGDVHLQLAPAPLSYVPALDSRYSDHMGFAQRLDNFIRYWSAYVLNRALVFPTFDRLCERHLGADVSYEQLYQRADVVLLKIDFVLEYPRPTMPNFVYVGGLQCQEARPLAGELAALYAGAGPHGVVVASFGSLVSSLPPRVAEEVARAFARLPQKVAWRHAGPRPLGLGDNTLLLPWLPQNDLLAHGATRAFVSHGGEGGVYEAIRHGVPLLGMPMYGDQHDNVARLVERGAALSLGGRLHALTSDEFLAPLRRLLDEPRFGEAMRRLSLLHRDTPVPPLDLATFWVEFLARNGGASHLRVAGLEMPTYRRCSLDVALALLLALVAAVAVGALMLVRVKRWLCQSDERPKRE